jgi:RimJ/RimL family protein N-acetyltransferase
MERKVRKVRLRTGHAVWVRPIRASDADGLQRAFAFLSDRSRYQRFLTGTPYLTDQRAAYFSEVDHDHHEALVAIPEQSPTDIVGVARFIRYRESPRDADLAITVNDDWHDRGLATGLLALLSARAREVGVQRFVVDLLADNPAVLALLRRAGLVHEVTSGELVNGYIELEPGGVPLTEEVWVRATDAGDLEGAVRQSRAARRSPPGPRP